MEGSAPAMRAITTAFRDWSAVIGFVAGQEFDEKFKGSRIGAFLTFAEPFLLILMFCAIKGLFRGRLPDYGTSLFVFYSSGVFPFYLFLRLSTRTRGIPYDALHRFPRVSSTDFVIASVIAEATIVLSSMFVWFLGMYMLGLKGAEPVSVGECAASLVGFLALGLGVGLINSALSRRFKLWRFIYARATYGLMFLSGVFFVADLTPPFIRDWLVWNPLMHGVEWFRLGLYGRYPTTTLDRQYFLGCAGAALMIGIMAHKVTIRLEKV